MHCRIEKYYGGVYIFFTNELRFSLHHAGLAMLLQGEKKSMEL